MKLEDMLESALAKTIADPDVLRQTLSNIMATELPGILNDVASDFETEGCEDCGTVSISNMNPVRALLGWGPLDTDEEDRDEDQDEPAANDPAGDDGYETDGEDE